MATIEVDIDIYEYMDIDDVLCYLEENEILIDDRKKILKILNSTAVNAPENMIKDYCYKMSFEEAMSYVRWLSHYHGNKILIQEITDGKFA